MKKVLFICPNFFEYHKIIKSKLEDKGFKVDWIDDRPKLGVLGKGILRLFPKLMSKKIDHYFDNEILKQFEQDEYDYVFLILGQSFNSKHISKFKTKNPNTKIIYYAWDSVENFPNIVDIAKECDYKYSFDFPNCEKYGFIYLPLFFTKESSNYEDNEYYASFIGTIKKGKYQYLKNIKEQFDTYALANNKKNFFYFYLQSKMVFWFYKIFYKEFRHAKMSEFKFKKLSYDETLSIQENSDITIDVTMAKQNGYTMRTFECLALGSKLFTTNKNIMNAEFYNNDFIYVYDNKDIDFKSSFFLAKYNSNIVSNHSVESWLDIIFKDN